MADAARPARPWSGNQGRTVVLVAGGGFALVVWGWASARDAGSPTDQVPQLVLAMVGCAAVLVGAISWIGVGRSALRGRATEVLDRLAASLPAAEPPEPAEAAMADSGDVRVVVPGTSRYHRADCLLVRRKPVERGPVEADLRPCEMCTP